LLYPLLHRLERLGYVESSWQSVTGERRRKYYHITDTGAAELVEQRRQWDTVVDALKGIWLGPDDFRPLAAIPLGGQVRRRRTSSSRRSSRSGVSTRCAAESSARPTPRSSKTTCAGPSTSSSPWACTPTRRSWSRSSAWVGWTTCRAS